MNSLGRKQSILLSLLILLLSSAFTPAQPQPVDPQPPVPDILKVARFDRLTPADGLSFPVVQSILQDSQGYLWFATAGGLEATVTA